MEEAPANWGKVGGGISQSVITLAGLQRKPNMCCLEHTSVQHGGVILLSSFTSLITGSTDQNPSRLTSLRVFKLRPLRKLKTCQLCEAAWRIPSSLLPFGSYCQSLIVFTSHLNCPLMKCPLVKIGQPIQYRLIGTLLINHIVHV